MSKIEEFVNSERSRWGKVFVDVNYAIDNISPFLEKADLKKRKYVAKLPILKKYMDLLDAAEAEGQKGGFLNMFHSDKSTDLLREYKHDNKSSFIQLENCKNCACLNCTAECNFNGCLGCRAGSHIKKCDHSKINVTFHEEYTLDLKNDRTGRTDKYTVLATLQDSELDRQYIIIENRMKGEKFILYYYPGISEDTYGEITDGEEFDFIVSTFEGIEE